MKYTINDFRKEFPNDEVCLSFVFDKKFAKTCSCGGSFYQSKTRKCYACSLCGKQIHPLAGTIFEKSSTPLTLWFYAIYLMAQSKNGVSAKELQRQLGVTYKCAWRIASQIRELMKDGGDMLSGTVEVDETYVGGFRKGGYGGKGKSPVVGMVERGGKVKAKAMPRQTHLILKEIKQGVKKGSHIVSDKFGVYRKTEKLGYTHSSVNHWKKEFVRGGVHTNTIEGFWSQLKRSLNGTYHSVSPKHLQSYVDEFSFRYNHRGDGVFSSLTERI